MDIEKAPNIAYFCTINGSKINLPKVSAYKKKIAKFLRVQRKRFIMLFSSYIKYKLYPNFWHYTLIIIYPLNTSIYFLINLLRVLF